MKLIDTNSLLIFIVGLINPKLINTHKRTSIYEEQDFYDLASVINDTKSLVILPNVWTEVDNLLNNFNKGYKVKYVKQVTVPIKSTSEKFLESKIAIESSAFYDLGITDSLLLECSKKCELLITSDSMLSDYALANGIKIYDLVKNRNKRLE